MVRSVCPRIRLACRRGQKVIHTSFVSFGTNPKTSGTRYEGKNVQMCKIRWVERHIYDTFYEMYEFLCECLKAVLNPSEYHDIYEEVALTGSWDQETRTKAQGLLTNLTSSRAIIAFITTKNVLENVRPMASKLQKRDLNIYQAYSMIDQTRERMITMKYEIEEEYSVWYSYATRLATLLGTSISAPGTPR